MTTAKQKSLPAKYSAARNPFRDPTMRKEYEGAMKGYTIRHETFFDAEGNRREPGSSIASYFWRGYDGITPGSGWDAPSRKILAYAYWCAGRDAKKHAPLPEKAAQ